MARYLYESNWAMFWLWLTAGEWSPMDVGSSTISYAFVVLMVRKCLLHPWSKYWISILYPAVSDMRPRLAVSWENLYHVVASTTAMCIHWCIQGLNRTGNWHTTGGLQSGSCPPQTAGCSRLEMISNIWWWSGWLVCCSGFRRANKSSGVLKPELKSTNNSLTYRP